MTSAKTPPLAERLRPKKLSDVAGQSHVLGQGGFIRQSVESGTPVSFILWGPPGCGKTTIARLYANAFAAEFIQLSAVLSGVADLKKVAAQAQKSATPTVLFVDEIHRFNKAQQDAFLPFVEDGTLILIGATTENPSFSLNNALLSRVRVATLNTLSAEDLTQILETAKTALGNLPLTKGAQKAVVAMAAGDGRYLLNLIENILATAPQKNLTEEEVENILQQRAALYDKNGEGHYNLISALHKAVRASDVDAALYWLCRMLNGGENPLFLARRLIRMASEDVGLADPQALQQAMAARDAYQMLGTPEGELALAQATAYLAMAPKSNALYTAFGAASAAAQKTGDLPPPKHALNAPTQLMKNEGYSLGYKYDHDQPDAFSGQRYFPPQMGTPNFYQPVERGFEREMQKRISYFNKLRKKRDI